MGSMSTLAATTTWAEPQATVSVGGEIDIGCADDFESIILLALTEPAIERVTVHLGAVSFIDAAGLSALVHARNTALALNKTLVLDAVPPCLRRLFELTGLGSVFCFAATATDAEHVPERAPTH